MSTFDALAVDLGASNGRGIVGRFDGDKLALKEVLRFPNQSVRLGSHWYWDFLNIFDNVKNIVRSAAREADIRCLGVDSWAHDYGLLDAQDNPLGLVHTYRDERTAGIDEVLLKRFSFEQAFRLTGMRYSPICTLLQLTSMLEHEKTLINSAHTFLFIADLINFFLTGHKGCNSTTAEFGMLYDLYQKDWQREVIGAMGLPDIFPPIVQPGTVIGSLKEDIFSELMCGSIDVCAVSSHDTPSAMDFIAERGKNVVISSGTWSMMGCNIGSPETSKRAYDTLFTNQLGFDGQMVLSRGVTGMWILQEVMREWRRDGFQVDYGQFNEAAIMSGYQGYIDVDRAEFALPGNMPQKIYDHLKSAGQPLPSDKVEMYKCILLGLAMKYKQVIGDMESLLGEKFEWVSIVGGGAKNTALNQMTADICGIPVFAGPYEATAMGNVICQLIAEKEISGKGQAMEIVKRSADIRAFYPGGQPAAEA